MTFDIWYLKFSIVLGRCVVPKALTLNTLQKGQNQMQEHQKNRAWYKVKSLHCETCLDVLDENQDAPKH